MFNRTLGRLAGLGRSWLILACALLLIAVSIIHIGSSLPGLSPQEAASRTASGSLHLIYKNPVNAPHKLLEYAAQNISAARLGVLRSASYLFWLFFALCFYLLARSWFGKTAGLLGAVLFVFSPFMLTAGRDASAAIMFYFPLAMMAVYFWLGKTDRPAAWLLLCVAAGLSIYTPGMIWWLVGAGALCNKKLVSAWKTMPDAVSVGGPLIFLFLLIPAILASVKDWHTALALAALPSHFGGPLQIIKHIGWMILALFVKMPYHDDLMLGRAPLFNLIQVALLIFGAYAFWRAARAKAVALALALLLAVILAGVSDDIQLLFLGLPAAGLIMTAGLRYLYIEWRSVFPRNPIPKSLALGLMAGLVAISFLYSLTYTLVARPHNTEAKSVYVLK